MALRNNHAVNVRFDNRQQLLEFFATFQESEVSNHFSFACMPPGIPSDPETRGIVAQLAPVGRTAGIDRRLFELLDASFHDGMLAKWQAEGRVEMLPRLFAPSPRRVFPIVKLPSEES